MARAKKPVPAKEAPKANEAKAESQAPSEAPKQTVKPAADPEPENYDQYWSKR